MLCPINRTDGEEIEVLDRLVHPLLSGSTPVGLAGLDVPFCFELSPVEEPWIPIVERAFVDFSRLV